MSIQGVSVNFKYFLLVCAAHFFEFTHISSSSSLKDGTYNNEEFSLIRTIYATENSPIVIDVGANLGVWAEEFLNCSPNAQIFALEPNEKFFNSIKKIGDERILPINLALSSVSQNLKLYEKGGGGSAYFDDVDSAKLSAKKVRSYEIRSTTGDDFVQSYRIRVDFIKIDTDGMDFDVVKSFGVCLQTQRPLVQFEFSFRFARRAEYTLRENLNFLSDLGYKVFVIDKASNLKKIKFPRLEVLNHQSKNFWAIPKERVDHLSNFIQFPRF
jgi:FkbM family methyltransferase